MVEDYHSASSANLRRLPELAKLSDIFYRKITLIIQVPAVSESAAVASSSAAYSEGHRG